MSEEDLLTSLPGFRDFYPQDWSEISYVLGKMREVANKYGYMEYEGPSLELVALIEAKSGEELMKEIFQLEDRSQRRLLLRPEQTPTLARMLAKEQQRFKRPIRWFCIPRLFRDETIQRGRSREFWQLNVDILGEDSIAADAETIAVGVDVVRSCGIFDNEFVVIINHRDLLNQLILSFGIRDTQNLISIVDKKMTFLQEKVEKELLKIGIDETSAKEESLIFRRILNSQGNFKEQLIQQIKDETLDLLQIKDELLQSIMISKFKEAGLDAPSSKKLFQLIKINGPPIDFLDRVNNLNLPDECQKSLDDLEELATYLEAFGVLDPVIFDASMARGLDYYTEIVYEAFDATGEVVRAIFGGGRYSDLVEDLGGTPLTGVGFGMGETVLLELMKIRNSLPDDISPPPQLYLAPIKTEPIPRIIELATRLREKFSLVCNPFDWRLRRHFESADDLGAKLSLLLGERDLENGVVSVRIMQTGEQIQIPMDSQLELELKEILANL